MTCIMVKCRAHWVGSGWPLLQKAGITGLFDSNNLDCLRLFLGSGLLCLGRSLGRCLFCFGRCLGFAGLGRFGSACNSRGSFCSMGFGADPAGSCHQREGHCSQNELFHVCIRFFWLCHIYNNMAVRLWHERRRDAITNLSLRGRAFAGIFLFSPVAIGRVAKPQGEC